MKSLRDEILLRKVKGGGFNFIWGGTPKISSEHREDFIVQRTISFKMQGLRLDLFIKVWYNKLNENPEFDKGV